jgi:hypothetical protein
VWQLREINTGDGAGGSKYEDPKAAGFKQRFYRGFAP